MMLAFPGLFPLLSCIHTAHTCTHTCTHACTRAHILRTHYLDSDEGQEKQPGLSLLALGVAPAAHMVLSQTSPKQSPSRQTLGGATAHRSCHPGVRSDCSGSDAHGMAWHVCAAPWKVREDPLVSALGLWVDALAMRRASTDRRGGARGGGRRRAGGLPAPRRTALASSTGLLR